MDPVSNNLQPNKIAMNLSSWRGRKTKSKRIYKLGVVVVVLTLAVVGGGKFFAGKSKDKVASKTLGKTNQVMELDQSLAIPIETAEGEGTGDHVTYKLTSAELTDEIILKGQKATAVNGRRFLIVNIKLTNPSDKSIKLETRNYVRLAVNESADRLAPNVHNDPVEVQPISDQQTRLGFSINETDSKLILYLGSIRGEKTPINLNFE